MFESVTTTFLEKQQPVLDEARTNLTEATEAFDHLVHFYPSGLQNPEPQEYFAVLATFLTQFQVRAEVVQRLCLLLRLPCSS